MHKASLGFSQSFIIECASGEFMKVPECPSPSFPLPKTKVLILSTMTNITNHTSGTSEIKSTEIEQNQKHKNRTIKAMKQSNIQNTAPGSHSISNVACQPKS